MRDLISDFNSMEGNSVERNSDSSNSNDGNFNSNDGNSNSIPIPLGLGQPNSILELELARKSNSDAELTPALISTLL